MSKPHNQCAACGEDFASLDLFDKHRTGSWREGRECLAPGEFPKRWIRDWNGVWDTPENAKKRKQAGERLKKARK